MEDFKKNKKKHKFTHANVVKSVSDFLYLAFFYLPNMVFIGGKISLMAGTFNVDVVTLPEEIEPQNGK